MANTTVNKKATFGDFTVTGLVKGLGEDSFQFDVKGKNNINWNQNVMSIRLDDTKGNSFFLNTRDGFDLVRGKDIYTQSKDGKNLKIPFGERMNELLLEKVDENKMIRVGYAIAEVEDEKGHKYNTWVYKNFLTVFDLIKFLKESLQNDMKVTFKGRTKYQSYNGETSEQYEIQRVYIEPQDVPEKFNTYQFGFEFNQTFLLNSDSVDDSKFESEGIAKVKAYIYQLETKKGADGKNIKTTNDEGKQVNAKFPVVYPVEYVVRAGEKKDVMKKVIDKYLNVTGDTVRCIEYVGKFVQGYSVSNITEDDLPEDVKEMIELGLYTVEDALKMCAGKERISEQQLIKPRLVKIDDKASIHMDDKTYTKDDLTHIVENEEVEVNVPQSNNQQEDDEVEDLLAGLDDLLP